jgi:hypothetical protein
MVKLITSILHEIGIIRTPFEGRERREVETTIRSRETSVECNRALANRIGL